MFPPYAGSDELVPPKRSSDRALLVLAAACSAPTSNRRLPAVEARRGEQGSRVLPLISAAGLSTFSNGVRIRSGLRDREAVGIMSLAYLF